MAAEVRRALLLLAALTSFDRAHVLTHCISRAQFKESSRQSQVVAMDLD